MLDNVIHNRKRHLHWQTVWVTWKRLCLQWCFNRFLMCEITSRHCQTLSNMACMSAAVQSRCCRVQVWCGARGLVRQLHRARVGAAQQGGAVRPVPLRSQPRAEQACHRACASWWVQILSSAIYRVLQNIWSTLEAFMWLISRSFPLIFLLF